MTMAVLTRLSSRPATHADDQLFRSLFAATRADFFLLDPDVRDALLGMQYRARRDQIAATHPAAQRHVLLLDGHAVGVLEVERVGGCVRIADIIVAERARRRGVATAALLGLTEQASAVVFGLSAGDERFGRLLERLGFAPGGVGAGQVEYRYSR